MQYVQCKMKNVSTILRIEHFAFVICIEHLPSY
jgi:hypothetical protein